MYPLSLFAQFDRCVFGLQNALRAPHSPTTGICLRRGGREAPCIGPLHLLPARPRRTERPPRCGGLARTRAADGVARVKPACSRAHGGRKALGHVHRVEIGGLGSPLDRPRSPEWAKNRSWAEPRSAPDRPKLGHGSAPHQPRIGSKVCPGSTQVRPGSAQDRPRIDSAPLLSQHQVRFGQGRPTIGP